MTAAAIHRLADSYIPRFAPVFTQSAERASRDLTDDAIAADLARGLSGQPTTIHALIDSMVIAKATPRPEEAVYAQILVDSAKIQGVVLDLQSPWVQQAAQKLAADLVTNVNGSTKRAIRQIIFESIRDGVPPGNYVGADGVSRLGSHDRIRAIVGLTERDAIAVVRRAESGRAVKQYRAKLLRARAMNIARTETMRAANMGQQLAWQEMASNNLIDMSRFRQSWMVTPDDRLCPLCAPMDGKLSPLGSVFESNERGVLPSERVSYMGETVDGPPLHSRCRCVIVADYGA